MTSTDVLAHHFSRRNKKNAFMKLATLQLQTFRTVLVTFDAFKISLSYHNKHCKLFRKEQVSDPSSLLWFPFSIMPPNPQKHHASSAWSCGRMIQGPATEALEYALLYDDGFILRSNVFYYDRCAAFDDTILLKCIQIFHPPISSHDSRIYHTIPIEYNDSCMSVMESENCSSIVPEVPWGTRAVDLDYG
jgi:hypothetical protein